MPIKGNVREGNLDQPLATKVNRVAFQTTIVNPVADSYPLLTRAPFSFNIDGASFKTDGGSCFVTVQINGVGVTGLSGNASTTMTNATAPAFRTVNEGDEIRLSIAFGSSPDMLGVTIYGTEL